MEQEENLIKLRLKMLGNELSNEELIKVNKQEKREKKLGLKGIKAIQHTIIKRIRLAYRKEK